jgi:hypothetical protein
VRGPLPLIIYPYHSRRLSLVRWAAAPHEHMGENGSQTGWIPSFEDYGVQGGAGTGAEGVSTVHLAHLHPVHTQSRHGSGHRWPFGRRSSNPFEAMLIWRVITRHHHVYLPSFIRAVRNVAAGATSKGEPVIC